MHDKVEETISGGCTVDIIPPSTGGIIQSPQNNQAITTLTSSTPRLTLPSQQHDSVRLSPPATKAGSSSSPGPSSSTAPSPAKPCQASTLSAQLANPNHKDCLLREFLKLCATVSERNSYNDKTQVIEKFLRKGCVGGEFRGSAGMAPSRWSGRVSLSFVKSF